MNHKHRENETCYDVALFQELQTIFDSLMEDYDDHIEGDFISCDFSPHTEIGKL